MGNPRQLGGTGDEELTVGNPRQLGGIGDEVTVDSGELQTTGRDWG